MCEDMKLNRTPMQNDINALLATISDANNVIVVDPKSELLSRSRAYFRKMRRKHIARKKAITKNSNWSYKYDGMYSKGKIHCSCPMCRAKTRNKRPSRRGYALSLNYKPSDRRKIEKMNYDHKMFDIKESV